jgi:hypothetical protein
MSNKQYSLEFWKNAGEIANGGVIEDIEREISRLRALP